jgi:hypothetical protein
MKMGGIDIKDINQLKTGSLELFESFPIDIMSLDSIRKKLKEVKWNFLDIEFAPIEKHIHPPSEESIFNEPIVWKRPKDFMIVDVT